MIAIPFSRESIPPVVTTASRVRKYQQGPKGQGVVKRYRKSAGYRKVRYDANREDYLARPFIAWDGEGFTGNDGVHRYVLLANSAGNKIVNRNGLRAEQCFRILLKTAAANPDAIHVGYGLGYDTNMILRSLGREVIEQIYNEKRVYVGAYGVEWRPGKSLTVSVGRGENRRSVVLYDILSFFQTSFVKACASYLGEDFYQRALIEKNKAERSSFRIEDLDQVGEYNDAELVNLVNLARELRERFDRVGIRPSRWDGPGSVAVAMMKKEGVQYALSRNNPVAFPSDVEAAIRMAMAGGRAEPVKYGVSAGSAHEYDINSAYPWALRRVPCLAHGRWTHISGDGAVPPSAYAVRLVRYRGPQDELPAPLYRRYHKGAIAYPGRVTGWYWQPEVLAAQAYSSRTGRGTITVIESYVWEPDVEACRKFAEKEPKHSPLPFGFIDDRYRERRELKDVGDGAHVGIKLGLNSLYGKCCQQVGWSLRDDGTVRIPPFHELAWAGYATSACRAAVLTAVTDHLDKVVAFATDAVFTTEPIPVTIGKELGEWEETRFRDLSFIQSGLWFGELEDGTVVRRSRGVDRDSEDFTIAGFARAMSQEKAEDRYVTAKLTRFIGAGLALATDWADFCTWKVSPKKITAGPTETSKRSHVVCGNCWPEDMAPYPGDKGGVWHTTTCPFVDRTDDDRSLEFPVEWAAGDDYMPELGRLRREHYEEDGE